MAKTPAFAFPRRFAEISGLSEKEVYRLCHEQVIPNERLRGGFRIDVDGAMAALRNRAATFSGHGSFIPAAPARPMARRKRAKAKSFTEMLDDLKYAD